MIKLIELLKEIGETTEPYPFTLEAIKKRGDSARLVYHFDNKNEDTIKVEIAVDMDSYYYKGPEFTVTFSDMTSNDDEDVKYGTMTNSGDSLKVISTVIACIKDAGKQLLGSIDKVKSINFKGDDKRFKIYLRYAQKQLPSGWSIETREGGNIDLVNNNTK